MHPMKKIVAAALAAGLWFGLGMANVASAATGVSIAVIRSQDILQQAPQFKDAEQSMKQEFQKRGQDLEAKRKQLAEDVKAYQRNSDIMTPDDREKKEKELNTRQIDLQYEQQKFKQDLQKRNAELNQKLETEVRDVIGKIAKKRNLDLVIADPVYVKGNLDITDDVVKQLKSEAASGK